MRHGDVIEELLRLVGCRSPEPGLENAREDAGGRIVLETENLPRRGHLVTEPTSASSNMTQATTPDLDIPVRPPRTGVKTAFGVRGLGVEEFVVLEVRIGVATRTRGAGGG